MSVLPVLMHLLQMGPPVSRIWPHSDLARWDSWELANESVFKSRLCIFSIHIVNVHNLISVIQHFASLWREVKLYGFNYNSVLWLNQLLVENISAWIMSIMRVPCVRAACTPWNIVRGRCVPIHYIPIRYVPVCYLPTYYVPGRFFSERVITNRTPPNHGLVGHLA